MTGSAKILVTGGTGYIGSHTIVDLLASGHEVEIVDNLSNSTESVVDRIGEVAGSVPRLHQVDLRNREALDDVFGSQAFDAVFHFAGLKSVAESVASPLAYFDCNVGGAVTLLESMSNHGVRQIVFSSSATVYGDPAEIPVSETTPTGEPANPYGRTKLMIEQILMDLFRSDDRWNIGILRYFNPVGAHPSGLLGETPTGVPNNLMPYLTQVAAGARDGLEVFGDDYPTSDGTGVRDFVHVVDLAQGHLAAFSRMLEHPGLGIWNLGTGRGTSVLDLVTAFERSTGVVVPRRIGGRRPGDIAAVWADVTKAEHELGWQAHLGIEDMCRDAWLWEQNRRGG